jgi:biotin-dependent carboxylase-like uncharacterized protein
MEVFEVAQPGPLTTIQDQGRYGYQQYGVPPSGAADSYASRLANILIGNDESAACLEITLLGLRLKTLVDTMIAITGADLGAVLNHDPLPQWQTVAIHSGDTVSFPRLRNGSRAYLAVAGGFAAPVVMGSAATYTRAGIGGLEGRSLRTGDHLYTSEPTHAIKERKAPDEYIPEYVRQVELRVVLGPQDDYFTGPGIDTFLSSQYTVSTRADRMGYRLDGPRIKHRRGADIVSDGIPLGAVQVPGDGLPIILLADRQTTGGYTKIATVISVDIPKIAQAKPGDIVQFQQVSQEEAIKALDKQEQRIKALREILI